MKKRVMCYDLKLVISGLYLVLVEGKRGQNQSKKVEVIFVKHHCHQPRLVFRVADLADPRFPTKIDHHVSNVGDRLGAIKIKKKRRIKFNAKDGTVTLGWQAPEPFEPLNYALDVRQVRLKLKLEKNKKHVAARFRLPHGSLYTQGVVSDPYCGDELRWTTDDPADPNKTIQTFITDDIVLFRPQVRDVFEVRVGGRQLVFNPRYRRELTLCISNDLKSLAHCQPESVTTRPDKSDKSQNPFVHLGFFECLGEGPIVLPEPVQPPVTPPNNECNGLIAFTHSESTD